MWSRTVGSALIVAGFVADPGVERCGEAWLGDCCGSEDVRCCGVCTACGGMLAATVICDGAGLSPAFSFRALLMLMLPVLASSSRKRQRSCLQARMASATVEWSLF